MQGALLINDEIFFGGATTSGMRLVTKTVTTNEMGNAHSDININNNEYILNSFCQGYYITHYVSSFTPGQIIYHVCADEEVPVTYTEVTITSIVVDKSSMVGNVDKLFYNDEVVLHGIFASELLYNAYYTYFPIPNVKEVYDVELLVCETVIDGTWTDILSDTTMFVNNDDIALSVLNANAKGNVCYAKFKFTRK